MASRLTRWLGFAVAFGLLAPATSAAVTTVHLDPSSNPQSVEVAGDASSEHVELSYDAASGRILVSEPGITSYGSLCSDLGDTVSCRPPAPSPFGEGGGVVINLLAGDNSAHVSPTFPASIPVSFFSWKSGSDSFVGGPENDGVDTGPGADFISGGLGEDTVNYAQRVTPVRVVLDGTSRSGNELDGPPGARDRIGTDVEDIIGGNAGDRLVGNAAPNTITGFKGRDVLVGLGGPDRLAGEYPSIDFHGVGTRSANRLYGGSGRDFLVGSAGGDGLFGGPGIDRIDAKDKQHEKTIDCGGGDDRRERATRDGGDPHPISC